jgi:hypothetical protein
MREFIEIISLLDMHINQIGVMRSKMNDGENSLFGAM